MANNRREKIVREQAEKDGWEVLDKGWPDFLLYNEKENKVLFIEVKSNLARKKKLTGGELTKEQKLMHHILKRLGFIVKVVHIE